MGTVFTWIKRHGKKRFVKLVRLWGDARQIANEKVVAKVVDEMWTYLRRNMKPTSGSSLASCTLL